MDWKEMLGQLKNDPTLPPGDDSNETEVVEESAGKDVKKDVLHVLIDKKGRKGKTATIVEGFSCGDDEVADVATMLKKKLGVGGSSRGGEILIQGDCVQKVRQLLIDAGFKVK